MKTRKPIAWLLCFVMLFSVCAVIPANATLINEGTITNDGNIENEGDGYITVTFLSGTPENETKTQSATAGTDFILASNTFTWAEHVFLHWVDESGNTYDNRSLCNFTGNVTLTAVWEITPSSSTVGGEEAGTSPVGGGGSGTSPAGGEDEPVTPVEPTVYFITYYPNHEGYSGRMNQQDIPKGNTDNLYPNTFSCTGYRFRCWNTQPDGSGTNYNDRAKIEPSGNVNLYAQWTLDTWNSGGGGGGGGGSSGGGGGSSESGGSSTPSGGGSISITFNPGNTVSNNNNSPYTQTASSGVETTLTPNRFTNTTGIDPYTFDYWIDANGNTYADGASVTFYGDVTLTAVWASSSGSGGGGGGGTSEPGYETVTVTFQSGYEVGAADYTQTVEKGVTTCLDEIRFTRSGYTFYLWAGDDGNQYSNGESVSFVEDVTLIAIWVESASNSGAINGGENSITYSPSAGDHDPGGYISVSWNGNVGSAVTVTPHPSYGYSFLGLDVTAASGASIYPSTNADTGVSSFSMPQSNVTITGSFARTQYKIDVVNDGHATVDGMPSRAYVGDTVTFHVLPETGYKVTRVILKDPNATVINIPVELLTGAIESEEELSFTMPDYRPTVEVVTTRIVYNISYDLQGGGTHDDITSAAPGEGVTIVFYTDDGYEFTSGWVTKASGGAMYTDFGIGELQGSVSFTMPDEAVTVHTVRERMPYDIRYQITDGVTLVTAPTSARPDSEVTVAFSVDEGYSLTDVHVEGDEFYDTFSASPFSFTMPGESVDVSISAEEVRHDITGVTIGQGGSVSFPSSARVGQDVTVTFDPDDGHVAGRVLINTSDGDSVAYTGDPTSGSVTFEMPDDNVVITTYFWGAQSSISYTVGEGATLDIAPTTAREGEDVTVSYTLEPGYRLYYGDITGNNGAYWQSFNSTSFTFTMPAFDVLIEIATMHPTYTVTKHVDSTLGAIVTNVDSSHYGEEIIFTVQVNDPDEYKLKSLTAKDNSGAELALLTYSVGDTVYYYFDMPMGGVDIFAEIDKYFTVTFAPNGGDGDAFTVETFEWDTVTLPVCEFMAPEGTYFAGWEFGDLYFKPGTNTVFSSNSTINAHWNTASAIYAGISQTNGTLSLDLYVEICYSRPEDHALMISGSFGTFKYTLDEAVFEEDFVFNKNVYKYSVELTPLMLVDGIAYVVDDLDANGEWIMADAGLFYFTADPTASVLSVEVEDWDTGVTQIQPSYGEFLFALPPYGPEITVTYPGTAPVVPYGDVNNDGAVNSIDASLILQYIANYDDETLISTIDIPLALANVNGDYQITALDASLILQYAANYDESTGTSTVVLGPQN